MAFNIPFLVDKANFFNMIFCTLQVHICSLCSNVLGTVKAHKCHIYPVFSETRLENSSPPQLPSSFCLVFALLVLFMVKFNLCDVVVDCAQNMLNRLLSVEINHGGLIMTDNDKAKSTAIFVLCYFFLKYLQLRYGSHLNCLHSTGKDHVLSAEQLCVLKLISLCHGLNAGRVIFLHSS